MLLLHYLAKCGNTKIAFFTRLFGWLVGWSLTSLFSTNTAISETSIFHSNSVVAHQSELDLFNLFDSRLILTLLYNKSCNQCVQLGAVGGVVQENGSRERCSSWTVLHAQCISPLSSGFPLLQGNAEALDR